MRLARVGKGGLNLVVYIDDHGIAYPLVGSDVGRSGEYMDDVLQLIEMRGAELQAAEALVKGAIERGERLPLEPDRWLPPIARPTKVIGVAANNSAFAPASYRYFDKPSFFMKSPSALIGCGEPIVLRREYGLTHPEAELACVIGKRSSGLSEADAKAAVFGYTIINDITSVGLKDEDSIQLEYSSPPPGQTPISWRRLRDSNDWDLYLTYHLRSKCTDTFGPIGPWITTADQVPNPDSLGIRAWLGNRMIAEDSTARLSFSISRVIAHLSRYLTLEAGDIVHFGTALDPRRFALREANILRDPSDIRIEIDGLGVLVNPVRVLAD